MLVAEEMGRLVAPGPLLPVNVVADAVAASGTAEQQAEVLARPGRRASTIATWAFAEPGGEWDAAGVALHRQPDGATAACSTGTKSVVEAAGQADVAAS